MGEENNLYFNEKMYIFIAINYVWMQINNNGILSTSFLHRKLNSKQRNLFHNIYIINNLGIREKGLLL